MIHHHSRWDDALLIVCGTVTVTIDVDIDSTTWWYLWSDQGLPPATRARMLAKQMRTPPLFPLPCCATANYDAPELICSLLFV